MEARIEILSIIQHVPECVELDGDMERFAPDGRTPRIQSRVHSQELQALSESFSVLSSGQVHAASIEDVHDPAYMGQCSNHALFTRDGVIEHSTANGQERRRQVLCFASLGF